MELCMPPHVYIDDCFEQLLEPAPPWWLRGWFELVYRPDRLKVAVVRPVVLAHQPDHLDPVRLGVPDQVVAVAVLPSR